MGTRKPSRKSSVWNLGKVVLISYVSQRYTPLKKNMQHVQKQIMIKRKVVNNIKMQKAT